MHTALLAQPQPSLSRFLAAARPGLAVIQPAAAQWQARDPCRPGLFSHNASMLPNFQGRTPGTKPAKQVGLIVLPCGPAALPSPAPEGTCWLIFNKAPLCSIVLQALQYASAMAVSLHVPLQNCRSRVLTLVPHGGDGGHAATYLRRVQAPSDRHVLPQHLPCQLLRPRG